MGASGSGKSTMLNILGTLDRPTAGDYLLDGEPVREPRRVRAGGAAQPQDRLRLPVVQPAAARHRRSRTSSCRWSTPASGAAARRKKAERALERVGLGDRMDHLPNQLSGGQQQRVSIARAIVNEPLLLLADEPTGALDSTTTKQVMELFVELHRQGMTVVLVTHDPNIAAYAERVVTFKTASSSATRTRAKDGECERSLSHHAATVGDALASPAPRRGRLTLAAGGRAGDAHRSAGGRGARRRRSRPAGACCARSSIASASRSTAQLQELWNKSNIGGPTADAALHHHGRHGQHRTRPRARMNGGVSSVPERPSWAGPVELPGAAQLLPVLRLSRRVERVSAPSCNETRRWCRSSSSARRPRWRWRAPTGRCGASDLLRDVQQAALQRMVEAEQVAEARLRAGLAPPIDKNRAMLRRLSAEGDAGRSRRSGARRRRAARRWRSASATTSWSWSTTADVPDAAPAAGASWCATRSEAASRSCRMRELQVGGAAPARAHRALELLSAADAVRAVPVRQQPLQRRAPARARHVAWPTRSPACRGNLTLGARLTMNFFDTLNTYTATGTRATRSSSAAGAAPRRAARRRRRAHRRTPSLTKLYERRAPLTGARDVARDNLTILEARYKNGDALVIEFLDAQIDLANAELQLADVTAQLQLAWHRAGGVARPHRRSRTMAMQSYGKRRRVGRG